ncbi:MAG: extensin family protein, partial [Mesorhizobium sp.]
MAALTPPTSIRLAGLIRLALPLAVAMLSAGAALAQAPEL